MIIAPSPLPQQRLRHWRDGEAQDARSRGELFFTYLPDAWFEEPHWFCSNGHVSGRYLGSEMRGPCCLACGEEVLLGPHIGEAAFAPIAARLRCGTLADSDGDDGA